MQIVIENLTVICIIRVRISSNGFQKTIFTLKDTFAYYFLYSQYIRMDHKRVKPQQFRKRYEKGFCIKFCFFLNCFFNCNHCRFFRACTSFWKTYYQSFSNYAENSIWQLKNLAFRFRLNFPVKIKTHFLLKITLNTVVEKSSAINLYQLVINSNFQFLSVFQKQAYR
jgi:hypothetical protein